MTAEKKSDSVSILNSVLSGIVLAALTGIMVAQTKNSDKLSDIRTSMMPREEMELKMRQIMMDMRRLETMYQIQEVAIGELKTRMENTVRTRTP